MDVNFNISGHMTARQFRVCRALLNTRSWISREAIDSIAGTSNGPGIILQLRELFGYDCIETKRIHVIDRDGLVSYPGRYRLTPDGRAKLAEMGVK